MTITKYKKWIWENLTVPYIRKRDGKGDYGRCFTCGIVKSIKELHCGHWRHGSTKQTYYYEKNIHLQCRNCNFYRDGARDIYAVKLEKCYGYGILQEIDVMDKPGFVLTIEKLKKIEEEYKNKLK